MSGTECCEFCAVEFRPRSQFASLCDPCQSVSDAVRRATRSLKYDGPDDAADDVVAIATLAAGILIAERIALPPE